VRAGNVASRKNHDHEGKTDGQRRDDSRIGIDHAGANREDKEEGADEFNDKFFHGDFPGSNE
jgi:hypothetical protein